MPYDIIIIPYYLGINIRMIDCRVYFPIILLVLGSALQIDCQSDIVIYKDGTKVEGEIKSKGSYKNEIQFRSYTDSKYQTIEPKDLVGILKGGIEYRSILINENYEMYEVLVLGEISLYQSEISPDVQEFIAVKNVEAYKLREEIYNEGGLEKRRPLYVRGLKLLLQDEPSIMKKVDQMRFRKSSLVKLVSEYNNAKNNLELVKSRSKKSKIRWSVSGQLYSAGLSISSTPLLGETFPGIGIGFEVFMDNRFIISSGIRYANVGFDFRREEFDKSILRNPS